MGKRCLQVLNVSELEKAYNILKRLGFGGTLPCQVDIRIYRRTFMKASYYYGRVSRQTEQKNKTFTWNHRGMRCLPPPGWARRGAHNAVRAAETEAAQQHAASL